MSADGVFERKEGRRLRDRSSAKEFSTPGRWVATSLN